MACNFFGSTAISLAVISFLTSLSHASRAENQWVEPTKLAVLAHTRPQLPANHPYTCSQTFPLCAHSLDSSGPALAKTLRTLETAYRRVVYALPWRAPLPDLLGPNGGFDVYLLNQPELWSVRPDPIADSTHLARTSAYATIRSNTANSCELSFALSASIAKAGIFAIDAAANEQLANATASYIAHIADPCLNAFVADIDDFQASPHLAVSNPTHTDGRGAALFPWFLQATRGSKSPNRGGTVDLLHALWALSPQPAPKDCATLINEPDFIDSVAILAADKRQSLPDLWLDFAVARAFVGSRDNGVVMPDTRFLDNAGAVRFEWSVPYSSLPRRLAPKFAVEPSGASFIWISLDKAPKSAGLGFRAEWEPPVVFRFALVLIDSQGQILSRHNPVSPERDASAEYNIETLDGASGMIVVATNTGSVLKDIAFDPDSFPYTPSGYAVSLFAQ